MSERFASSQPIAWTRVHDLADCVASCWFWLGLMSLLALTVGLAFLDLDLWGLAFASLIAGVYMEVLERGHLPRLAVVTMVFFLTVLFGMTLWLS